MVSISADCVTLTYHLRQRSLLSKILARTRETPSLKRIDALKGVSFELRAGDRLGLVGANGSGKTTLLKVLYGIYEASSGRISVNGRVDALFNINLGFRAEATGRRNILLRGLINGWSPDEIEAKTNEIIEFSELGDFIELPYKTYSQGMAARLAFSIATTLEPEILLMDEWIGAGDPNFQQKAKQRMDALAEKAGIIVLASHNHRLIRQTCTKVIELRQGQMVQLLDIGDWKDD